MSFIFKVLRIRTVLLLKCISLTVFLSIISNNLQSQNASIRDSLQNIINSNVLDSSRFIAYLHLFEISFQSDTAKANAYLLHLDKEIEEDKYDISSNWIFYLGNIHMQYKNDYSSAIKYYSLAYQKAKTTNNSIQVYYECWLGYTYSNMGEHELARKHLLNAIETAENNNISRHLPFAYLTYAFELRNAYENEKAINNFSKSYEISTEIGDSTYIHTALHEIGNIYSQQRLFDSAVDYHKKALEIREKLNETVYLMYSYNDIAIDYSNLDSFATSLYYFKKAEEIAGLINDNYTRFKIYNGIVVTYSNLGDYNMATQYLTKMKTIAAELKIKSIYANLYEGMYFHYKSMRNYEEAMFNLELFVVYRDSVSSEEIQKNLNDLDVKYETVKKDKELLENQSHIKRQQIIILFSIIGLIVFAVFMIIVLRQYRQKKEAYYILEIQNQEILQQKEEIQSQAEHLEEANFEITGQKNVIEKSHRQITASINYAKRIQEAILPDGDFVQMLLPEHFIFYKPRDIVSGDFYFIKLYKNNLFVAVADCTGHGVPGAFMSMLGFALINELIRKPEILNSAQLLDELRNQIKTSLQQTGKSDEAKDGMDIAFLTIDIETNVLNFAGANNPLFLFRDNILSVYRADSMPISVFIKETDFTNHTIELRKGDMLYIFSDGFVSQFDKENKTTYKSKRFKELLTSIHKKELSEQKSVLESEFFQWKGTNFQTDDILILGIRI